MKKYEFTGETMTTETGVTLKRIHALIDIPNAKVKAGDLGGWIEDEKNLSQKDSAWVYDDAQVFGNALVYDDAQVFGNALVYDDAQVFGNASVHGNALVYDDAQVFGNAWVYDDAQVFGNAWVYYDAEVCEYAEVYGNAKVYGNAEVFGNARIYGDAFILERQRLGCNADIHSSSMTLTIGPIGSRSDFTTFYHTLNDDIFVCCGCFNDGIDKFLDVVSKTHGGNEYAMEYRMAAEFARSLLEKRCGDKE